MKYKGIIWTTMTDRGIYVGKNNGPSSKKNQKCTLKRWRSGGGRGGEGVGGKVLLVVFSLFLIG